MLYTSTYLYVSLPFNQMQVWIAAMFSSLSCSAADADDEGDCEGDSDSCLVRLLAEIDGGVTRPRQTVTAAAAERTPETQGGHSGF